MVVPVVYNNSVFDFNSLRAEQSRISREMMNASPRDIKNTSEIFEVEDNAVPPNRYPTFLRTFYGEEGSEPTFELYMRDQFDQEFKLSNTGSAVAINKGDNQINPANFSINSRTGQIFNEAGTEVGGIKFDGVAGLAMGTLGLRLTEVSNTIDGLSKVLTVAGATLDAAINTIR